MSAPITRRGPAIQAPSVKCDSTDRLQHAFHWLASARKTVPRAPLRQSIELARGRFALTPTEVAWVRWTLAPEEMALQSKEPDKPR